MGFVEKNSVRQTITNFGGNLHFTPAHLHAPTTEAGILAILDRHARGKVRVVGALHAWSPAIVCADALVDLQRFYVSGGGSRVTPDVERVIGRKPISFDQFARDHASAWK